MTFSVLLLRKEEAMLEFVVDWLLVLLFEIEEGRIRDGLGILEEDIIRVLMAMGNSNVVRKSMDCCLRSLLKLE